MSQLNIINFRDIGINNYNFIKPTRNVGNSYIAHATYSKNIRCIIQLPKLRTPEGIITIDKKEYLTLEIDKYNWNVFEFLSNVDEYCIKYLSDKSIEWFDSEYSVESIENSYKNSVKLTSTKKLPVIRLRIPPGERDNIYFFDVWRFGLRYTYIPRRVNLISRPPPFPADGRLHPNGERKSEIRTGSKHMEQSAVRKQWKTPSEFKRNSDYAIISPIKIFRYIFSSKYFL